MFLFKTIALILCIVYLDSCVETFDHENIKWEPKVQSTRRAQSVSHPLQYDSALLYHSRKFAGTSMRIWTQSIVKHNVGNTTQTKEGYTISNEYTKRPATLWITSIRDPFQFILSSYRFEGRWSQMKRSSSNAISIDQWINRTLKEQPKSFVWVCVLECFTKWSGGWNATGRFNVWKNLILWWLWNAYITMSTRKP